MMARLQEATTQSVSRHEQEDQEQSNAGGDRGNAVNTKIGVRSDISGTSRGATGSGGNGERAETDVLEASDGGGAVAAGVVEEEWVEETVKHPAPDYGVDSPVIR